MNYKKYSDEKIDILLDRLSSVASDMQMDLTMTRARGRINKRFARLNSLVRQIYNELNKETK